MSTVHSTIHLHNSKRSDNPFTDLSDTNNPYTSCILCPRMCRADRRTSRGFCQAGDTVKIARAALHPWEEPCISGTNGSGTVFFSGCTLKCVFCQNHTLSHDNFGKEITVERLAEIFLELQSQGAHNINLVTAPHYLPSIKKALDQIGSELNIPVVLNCGGYERVETIREYADYIDIYLPDLKYYNSELSSKYSAAKDYFDRASKAIEEMIAQTGGLQWNKTNPTLLDKGVIIRHMVLPGAKEDSIRLLHWIKESLPEGKYMLSLMSQYTPFHKSYEHPEINRKITTYEYNKVLDTAIELGLVNGYMQEKSSAKEEYTPPFDLSGV